ncbi:MAG: thioesterase family protein [Xanthomonadales bacterium]|nr:thioesterase family protein [Xanthomonadales bacterium]
MTRPDFPGPEAVRELPLQFRMRVPPEWEDRNGHVNVQYYLRLYELGAWKILEDGGFDEDWFSTSGLSVFDLEHHLHFRAELLVGDQVSCYHRVVACSDKRFHGVYLVVDDVQDVLAATVEYVAACIDMGSRRMAPWPAAMAAHMDRLIDGHAGLSWPAPLCGVLAP